MKLFNYRTCLFIGEFLLLLPIALFANTDNSNLSKSFAQNTQYMFIENKGQWNDDILFAAKMPNGNITIAKDGIFFDYFNLIATRSGSEQTLVRKGEVIKMKFPSSINEIEKNDEGDCIFNYFIGNNPSRWAANVRSYKSLTMKNIFPGIDIFFTINENKPKYDFILYPGANPNDIKISFEGGSNSNIDDNSLIVQSVLGTLRHSGLKAYQMKGDGLIDVECKFIYENGSFGFEVGEYNKNNKLIIDPTIFSSYYGGTGEDVITGIANTTKGELIVTGWTSSDEFKTAIGTYAIEDSSAIDAFVAKFLIDGGNFKLLTSTRLGSNDVDKATSLAVDNNGNIFITGYSQSFDYPTANAFQNNNRGEVDAFVTKLDSSASNLVFSTFLGGSKKDYGNAIIVNQDGLAYVIGTTDSKDFPIVSAYQKSNKGGKDIFIAKFLEKGNNLKFSTYFGGTSDDEGYALNINDQGDLYITGKTNSGDFPVHPTPYWPSHPEWGPYSYDISYNGDWDAFVSKITGEGLTLEYSTYFGGKGADVGTAVIGDADGSAWIAGQTFKETGSRTFPVTTSSYSTEHKGGWDCFIGKVSNLKKNQWGYAYQGLVFSTFFGGSIDEAFTIGMRKGNFLYFSGWTKSKNFPITGDESTQLNSGEDAFITIFDLNGTAPTFSSCYGGKGNDRAASLSLDELGNIYLAGLTYSSDFPVGGMVYKDSNSGGIDGFILKNTFATMEMNSPNGNEKFCTGATTNINWATEKFSTNEKFNIELFRGNNIVDTLAVDVPGYNYIWKISTDTEEGDDYKVRVTHMSGLLAYSPGVFSISKPPVINAIITTPENKIACEGESIILKADAKGNNLNYQWRLNGTAISSALDSIYIINNVKLDQQGKYDVVVSGRCKPDATSQPVQITIKPSTKVLNEPGDKNVNDGDAVTFSFNAQGIGLTYQWQKNNVDISQETKPTFSITSAHLSDSGFYRCIITADCGKDTTRDIKLAVQKVESVFDGSEFENDKMKIKVIESNNDLSNIKIEITSNDFCEMNAVLVDALGSVVKNIFKGSIINGLNNIHTDLTGLASGVYWIRFECGESVVIKKLQIIK